MAIPRQSAALKFFHLFIRNTPVSLIFIIVGNISDFIKDIEAVFPFYTLPLYSIFPYYTIGSESYNYYNFITD